jgi:hypothetical protein
MDQVAAAELGQGTRIASLQLGIDGGGGVGDCDSGYSCAYARNISWASENQPLPKTTSPTVLFDQIFDGFDPNATAEAIARRRERRLSVLDYVNKEVASLKPKLSQKDQLKLDEYTTGIRELELRVESGSTVSCDPIARPEDNLSYPDHVALMSDLMALAFQCDATRVITFMLGNAGSNRSYDFIGVSGAHHEISHHQDLQENLDKLTAIDIWEVEQYLDLLQKLDAIEEADGQTVLDNSAVFFSSEIEDGNSHAHVNLPVAVAGSLGQRLTTGQHLAFDNEPIANLFIRLLSDLDVGVTTFGDDGSGPLAL